MNESKKRNRLRAALIAVVVLVAGAPVAFGATAAAGPGDDSCVHEPTPLPEPATPTPGCVDEPTPEPTVEPTPEPTAQPTPVPTAEPTVEPTPEPTVLPPAEPTPEPTVLPPAEPTPSGEDEPAGGQLADTGPSGLAGFAVAGVVAVAAGALVLLGLRRPRDL